MYLGIDIGTSAVKAVILDSAGAVVSEAASGLGVMRPHPLWSEQKPEDWWQAVNAAVLALPANLRVAVEAIGLAGQMHGAVVLDRADKPLRPAILWNDGRSFQECAKLEARCPQSRALTGNAAMPGFTAPKFLWLQRHEPDIAARTVKILLPKDYVRLCMTGAHATDVSDASGTLWLDVGKRAWSADMLAACGLDESHMPSLHEGCAVTGSLRPAIAAAWGMRPVPVAAGGGDNAAGAIGCGATHPGDAFLSLGTSGVLFIVNERFSPAPERGAHAFCHALPALWHQMAVLLSAGASLTWIAGAIGAGDVDGALALARQGAPFSGGEIFLPYLSGERTPHNDPKATGVLFGLTQDSGPGALVRAVLEGVAFAFADGLSVLEEAGQTVDRLTLIGGGARSLTWAQILATALGKALVLGEDAHVGPAFGAARLARMAATGSLGPDGTAPTRLVAPDPALKSRMEEKYARFRALYPALKASFASG